jgi:hypothetical protein
MTFADGGRWVVTAERAEQQVRRPLQGVDEDDRAEPGRDAEHRSEHHPLAERMPRQERPCRVVESRHRFAVIPRFAGLTPR